MDDFELGLSSRASYKDEFYESFQAPKFYDFINPRESVNVDEWFCRGMDCCSVKQGGNITVQTTLKVEESVTSLLELKKPMKGSALKSKHSLEEKSSAENEDPNHNVEKNGKKPEQKSLNENSPAPKRTGRCLAKIPQAAPATVPQKKVLATRKAALEIKRQPAASKSLLETFKKQVQAIQTSKPGSKVENEAGAPKNYSSEFEESCKRSDDEAPACRRAIIGQDDSGRESAAAAFVVEQATILESAIKLLNLGDDDKSVKVCTEIVGALCADGKAEATSRSEVVENKQVFSFTAMRTENPIQRKRKSKELKERVRKENCSRKVTASTSPPASISSARPVATLKRPRVTCPQPFRLRTEERGAVKEIEFNKKMEHYIALKEGILDVPNPVSQPVSKLPELIPIKKFHFQRPERPQTKADNRSPVEVSIEMVTKDLAKHQIETGSDGVKQPRKQARALGVPSFSRPFRPQRSTKKLTVPVEPKFHAIHARRTCTRHNNNNVAQ